MALRVLLVEDDRELRRTLRDALTVEGYDVLISASATDAHAVIRHNSDRTDKALFTQRGRGPRIVVHEAYDQDDEARFVVDTQRLWHVVVHPGDAPRYALITSFESGPTLERWIEAERAWSWRLSVSTVTAKRAFDWVYSCAQ